MPHAITFSHGDQVLTTYLTQLNDPAKIHAALSDALIVFLRVNPDVSIFDTVIKFDQVPGIVMEGVGIEAVTT